MCGGPGGSLCKKPAGEPGEVSSILQIPGYNMPFGHCLFALLHVLIMKKGIFLEHTPKLFMAQL